MDVVEVKVFRHGLLRPSEKLSEFLRFVKRRLHDRVTVGIETSESSFNLSIEKVVKSIEGLEIEKLNRLVEGN
jgi:hypothetical protein